MTQLDRHDDVPVQPGSILDMPNPMALFRHDRLPRWALVRQHVESDEIDDVPAAVAATLETVASALEPGQRVCLAVGSRGIDRIADVATAAVAALRARGAEIFVVPAMGSHGGATAEGQLEVLASMGVTEATLGCPIRASMDTVRIGEAAGLPVYVDREAVAGADAIIPVNRVKPHTDFSGPVESGLLKMIAIGLGNQRGADTFHGEGFARFAELIPAVAEFTLSRLNIPFGLALVESKGGRLRRIEAVPSTGMFARERELQLEAREHLATLPMADIDVLILDRIGKDISGLGMDSNVVGRYYTGPTGRGPSVQRIVVRDLTDATEGNAVGIGMADVALRRAVDRMDSTRTYINCITAKTPEGARVAMTVDTDREALDIALACCLKVDPERARIVRILDTKNLGWFFASEPMLAELPASCEVTRPLAPIGFDDRDGLTDSFPS